MTLHDYGFDTWVEAHARGLEAEGLEAARVSAVERGLLLLATERGEIPAELSGRLSFSADSPADLPCVGDWVAARLHNDATEAVVHRVLPRKSLLRRRMPGSVHGVQPLAANVDTAFLIQSCHYDFNPTRLERYLVMAADGGVEPVVLLTKADLAAPEDLERMFQAVAAVTGARVLALSTLTGQGLEALRQALEPGRTCCLLGSSGVGKTTLLNRLLGAERFGTGGVSATGEGRHTTTRRQLVATPGGALVIDTPGMRELGLAGADDGLEAEFGEIARLAGRCRFADCRHEGEPGCAVQAALKSGELAGERLASYRKLRKESEFHGLSLVDKRRRDKAFGKMVKSVKESLR